jgi:hypothetical protein
MNAELSFIADKKISAPEKQMLRRGLFHSTKRFSEGGIFMLEVETPKDKNDLVRLDDEYGRAVIVKRAAKDMTFLEKETLILTIPG